MASSKLSAGKKRKVGTYLTLFAIACILPFLGLSLFTIFSFAAQERDISHNNILGNARSTALIVDLKLHSMEAALQDLAAAIPDDTALDLAFYQRAQIIAGKDEGAWIAAARTSGEMIFDTRKPFHSRLPPHENQDELKAVVEAQKPAVSNLFFRLGDNLPEIATYRPVMRQGQVRLVLIYSTPAATFAKLLAEQNLPKGWTVGISGRDRVIIARPVEFEKYVGQHLPPGSPWPPQSQKEAFFPVVVAGGIPAYLALVRSDLAGWAVVVGLPQAVANAPLHKSLIFFTAIGCVLLLVCIAGAFAIGSRLSRSMRTLSDAALGLVNHRPVPSISTSVREVADIETALQTASERLRENDRDLRHIQEHLACAQMVAGVGSIDRDFQEGTYTWSEATHHIFGTDPASFKPSHQSFIQMVHPDDRERVVAIVAKGVEASFDEIMTYRIIRPDGSERILNGQANLALGEDGRPRRLIAVVTDVTEVTKAAYRQAELETQLRHSEKLTALGTLAGGIAHDLNNTLVPILALSKLLAKEFPAESAARADLDTIIQASNQARDLVHQILSFSRKREVAKRPTDISAIVAEALRMLRASIPSTIDLIEDVKKVSPVLADANQVHQIIINLVTNAAHAIGDQIGKIIVSLSSEKDEKDDHSDMVVLVVTDTGCGMDDATLQRIFEPFYTTKPVGVGTGLGLSVVHGIVTAHGGTIEVRSKRGEGTEFVVRLPSCAEDLNAASDQKAVA